MRKTNKDFIEDHGGFNPVSEKTLGLQFADIGKYKPEVIQAHRAAEALKPQSVQI